MLAVHCRLICASASGYLRQLYTGFGLLARRGVVNVEIERGVQGAKRGPGKHRLNVVLNGDITICYDCRDPAGLYEDGGRGCDLYFKRSYDPTIIDQRSDRDRIRPLGFNYTVYGSRDAGLRRSYGDFVSRGPGWSPTLGGSCCDRFPSCRGWSDQMVAAPRRP